MEFIGGDWSTLLQVKHHQTVKFSSYGAKDAGFQELSFNVCLFLFDFLKSLFKPDDSSIPEPLFPS